MILSFGIFLKEINIEKPLIKDSIFHKTSLVYRNFKIIIILCLLIPVVFTSTIVNVKSILNKTEFNQFDRLKYNLNRAAIKNLKKIINERDTLYSTQNFFYLSLNKDLIHPMLFFNNFSSLGEFGLTNIPGIKYYDNKNHGSKELLNILRTKKPTWIILSTDFFDKESSNEYKNFVKKNWSFENTINAKQKYYLFKIKN